MQLYLNIIHIGIVFFSFCLKTSKAMDLDSDIHDYNLTLQFVNSISTDVLLFL